MDTIRLEKYINKAIEIIYKLQKSVPEVTQLKEIYYNVFQIQFENEKYWEFRLHETIKILLNLDYEVPIDEFTLEMNKYLSQVVNYLCKGLSFIGKPIPERNKFIFENETIEAIQSGYFLGIHTICRTSLARDTINQFEERNPPILKSDDIKSVMENELKILESNKYPIGIFNDDFLGVWAIFDDNNYGYYPIDNSFMRKFGRVPHPTWLMKKYKEYLQYRKFEVQVSPVGLDNKSENTPYQMDYLYSFWGPNLTEITLSPFLLKGFLTSFFDWIAMPQSFLPSINDDFYMIRVNENNFFIATAGYAMKDRLKEMLNTYRENKEEIPHNFVQERLEGNHLMQLINLKESESCKLDVSFERFKS